MNSALKQHIVNQKAFLKHYRMGSLWYETESGFLFEVPISETGNGIFNQEEKTITLMKWINRQLDNNDKAKLEIIHGY